MVIHDFDVMRIGVSPPEADTPLVVDSNAVLTFPVSCQSFQSIAGRNSQIIDRLSSIQHRQLSERRLLYVLAKPPGSFSFEDPPSFSVPEAPDHIGKYNVPRY